MRQRRGTTSAMIGAAGVWALVSGAAVFALHVPLIAAWLTGGGTATALLYGVDKRQAQRRAWRIAERTLLGMALLGGVAGAWFGMALFRHKTRHRTFFLVNAVATVLWVALAWLAR